MRVLQGSIRGWGPQWDSRSGREMEICGKELYHVYHIFGGMASTDLCLETS